MIALASLFTRSVVARA